MITDRFGVELVLLSRCDDGTGVHAVEVDTLKPRSFFDWEVPSLVSAEKERLPLAGCKHVAPRGRSWTR